MSLPIAAGEWTLDKAHSAVEFTVKHLGISKVRGRFNSFDASATVGDDLESSALSAEIDLSSVDTNNEDRDNHLRSGDFFNAEQHPKMSFSSNAISVSGDEYKIEGELSLNGKSAPITLDVEFVGTQAHPQDEKTRAGFSATGTLKRSDYGIEFNMPLGADRVMLSDDVKIQIEAQLMEG